MLYQPPINGDTGNDDRSYVNGDRLNGIEGSIPSAEAIEHPQREIINVIEAAGLTPDAADLTQLLQAINNLGGAVEVGTLVMWPANTPPAGYLVRDGSAISRAAYADLFAIIGTTYGVGDGVTTFNLMDDRGLFERGWDDGRGYDTGRVFGSEQADEFKAHTHSHIRWGGGGAGLNGGTDYNTTTATTGSAGGDETRPKNRAYLPIIKY